MPYATAAQLLERFDPKIVVSLVNDDPAGTNRQDLSDNAQLTAALTDASGAIDSALRVGKRYTIDDLTGLEGNAAGHLIRITCEIAISYLLERRPGSNTKLLEIYYERGRDHLKRLQTGEDVFNLDANIDKTLPTVGGPTATEYADMNRLPDRTPHSFPSRAQRLPTDRF